MAAKPKKTPAWQPKFLARFAEFGVVAEACRFAGISRTSVYDALKKNEAFKALYDDAEKDAADVLERECYRRAVEGTQVLKFHNGEPIKDPRDPTGKKFYVEHQYSDQLLLSLLKARKPATFGDKLDLNTNMPVMEPVVLEHYARPAKKG